MPEEPKTLTFHNKISANYRELHVDGAYGGITTRGYISLSFYAERTPIPKSSEFHLQTQTPDGNIKLGDKISDSLDSKTGILREFEMGIYMDLNAAKELQKFLAKQVEDLEKLLSIKNPTE